MNESLWHESPRALNPCVFFLCVSMLASSTFAGELESQITETQRQTEASRVVSEKLLGRKSKIVPVVIPVSNPTIGSGLAGAALYMHAQDSEDINEQTTMTGAFGMYTSSDSWAAGAFHDGYYFDDRLRIRVPVSYGEFNVKYYGIGENSPFRDNPVDYQAKGNMFVPRATMRLPMQDWFLGGQYRVIDIETQLDTTGNLADVPGLNNQQKTAGLGLVSLYDSRDSNLWPDKGSWLDFTATLNGEYIGGDYDYLRAIAKWAQYFPVLDSLTLIYRIDGQYIEGTAPFWDLARIRLRGFSSGQYLDSVAVTAQAELRWQLYPRWFASLFGGGGRIGDTLAEIGSAKTNLAGGTGFRFMLAEEQKLSIGLDLAYSDSAEVSLYFQVGDWLAN